jgi:uncharacterized RDD family membrane protein YckC
MVPFPAEHKATLGKRFLARLVDGLVLFVPTLAISLPIAGGLAIGSSNTGTRAFIAGVVSVGLSFAYNVVLESSQGRTIGKRALGLEVRAGDGLPTPTQAAKRNLYMLLSAVPGGIGGLLSIGSAIGIAVTISRDPYGRGAHDRYADVQVVDVALAQPR